jgi:bacterioferritin-associated ferredoxin
MIVCLCHRLSERDIVRAVEHGVRSFEELQDETCIARNCACCEDCARELFEDARSARSVRRHIEIVDVAAAC